MPDPEKIGLEVLARLSEGRRIAHERARRDGEALRALIRAHAEKDIAAGKANWGRAGRIAKRLHGLTSRRTIAKYLAALDQSFQKVEATLPNQPSEEKR